MAKKKLVADIMEGLRQAKAYARGEIVPGVRVHVPAEADAKSIRARTGMTQKAFAESIGVSVETLRNWEQKKRHPEGPARVLLALLYHNPQIVSETLGGRAIALTVGKISKPRSVAVVKVSARKPIGSRAKVAARAS
jgi:putative transcriptional regulator